MAGERFAYEPGDQADLREDIARGFIRQKVAVAILDDVETETVAAPETTARRPRRRILRDLGGLLPR